MFNPKDKLDKTLMKVSIYVILTFTIAYAISRVVYYVPNILKWLMYALSVLMNLITPLIYGLVIAYLIWPLVFKIKKSMFTNSKKTKNNIKNDEKPKILEGHLLIKEKKKTKKEQEKWKLGVSISLSYVLVLGLIIFLIYITYAAIAEKFMSFEFNGVIDVATEYVQRYETKINEITNTIKNLEVPDNIKEQLLNVTKYASNAISDFGTGFINVIKSFSKNVMNLFIGIIISFYIVLDYEFFKDVWNKLLMLFMRKRKRNKVNSFLTEINLVLSNFVRGQLLDCFIVAVISVIALLIINIDFAVILGIFAGIANVIPYFGPIIGMIPAVIIGLLSGEPLKALLAVIALIVIQQIDGNIIAPRIVGGSVGVHPVFVVISILIGAYFWGIVGMIIAVPICGVIKIILNKIIASKELEEEKEISR